MRLCIILLLLFVQSFCATAQADGATNIIDTALVKPEYPGGFDKLAQYLSLNLHYPCEAMDKKVEGEVIVGFTIGADGAVSNIQLLNKIGHGCDEEAARVVKNMPVWKPAIVNGKAVAVHYKLPVVFELPQRPR